MEFIDILYSNKENNACDKFFCYVPIAFLNMSPRMFLSALTGLCQNQLMQEKVEFISGFFN